MAFTYNEPGIWLEYAFDCARLAKEAGLYTAFVTNGFSTREALDLIGPYLDAFRVDVKGFSDEFYRDLAKVGRWRDILDSTRYARDRWDMHVEVVTNIIPTMNDDDAQLRAIARWMRDELGAATPWHVTAFQPHHKLGHLPPTPVATLERAMAIGRDEGLLFVYPGNVFGHPAENTRCPRCDTVVISRAGYQTQKRGANARRSLRRLRRRSEHPYRRLPATPARRGDKLSARGSVMSIVYACIAPHPPVIVHEVGRGREEETRRTVDALERVAQEIASFRPETVVVISPHGPVHPNGAGILTAPRAQGDMRRWDAPGVRFDFENDLEAVAQIQNEAEADGLRLVAIEHWSDGDIDGLDWGCTVPLYYLRSGLEKARLVAVTPTFQGPQYHFKVGEAIGRALEALGRRAVIICSADLSHCLTPGAPSGYNPAGREFDAAFQDAIATWDVDWVLATERDFRIRAAEDAIPQTAMLMGALSNYGLRPRILSYEGPFGVGYMVAAIDVAESASEDRETASAASGVDRATHEPQHPFVQLAKQTVERYVRNDAFSWPQELSLEFEAAFEEHPPAGVFVSIKKWGDLRGCIGTIEATQMTVRMEIVHNAVAACSRDPRFLPVTEGELGHLTYSVDVLTEPELIEGPHELDPQRYGVIVECGVRRGLLLPDLEGVESVEEQVRIARMKAGIGDNEPVHLYRFEVQRYT